MKTSPIGCPFLDKIFLFLLRQNFVPPIVAKNTDDYDIIFCVLIYFLHEYVTIQMVSPVWQWVAFLLEQYLLIRGFEVLYMKAAVRINEEKDLGVLFSSNWYTLKDASWYFLVTTNLYNVDPNALACKSIVPGSVLGLNIWQMENKLYHFFHH